METPTEETKRMYNLRLKAGKPVDVYLNRWPSLAKKPVVPKEVKKSDKKRK